MSDQKTADGLLETVVRVCDDFVITLGEALPQNMTREKREKLRDLQREWRERIDEIIDLIEDQVYLLDRLVLLLEENDMSINLAK